jgi:hypothetical protein
MNFTLLLIENFFSQLHFNLLSGDPVVSISISIVVLALLRSRINFAVLVLFFALVSNINPLYVSLGYVLYGAYLARFSKPKYRAVKVAKGVSNTASGSDEQQFDHLLIGNDLASYLTAALLARIGKKCCLMEPLDLPPQESPLLQDCPVIPLQPLTFFRPDRVHVQHSPPHFLSLFHREYSALCPCPRS